MIFQEGYFPSKLQSKPQPTGRKAFLVVSFCLMQLILHIIRLSGVVILESENHRQTASSCGTSRSLPMSACGIQLKFSTSSLLGHHFPFQLLLVWLDSCVPSTASYSDPLICPLFEEELGYLFTGSSRLKMSNLRSSERQKTSQKWHFLPFARFFLFHIPLKLKHFRFACPPEQIRIRAFIPRPCS